MNRLDLNEKISHMWRKSRADAGVSQDYVAKALGKSKKTVQNWEAGDASPNFQTALEWFDALGVPMYPYLMELLYPDEIKHLKRQDNLQSVRDALHVYVDELDEMHVRELLYLLYGGHGSSPTGTLDIVTTYLHLPLALRICAAEGAMSIFETAKLIGFIKEDTCAIPKVETVQKYIDTAKRAVANGKESYTLTEEREK